MLNGFAAGLINSTGKPYTVIATGLTVHGTTDSDPLQINRDSFTTTTDVSGQLLQDGNIFHLVGQLSRKYTGLYTGILYTCNELVSISRYPVSIKDIFNRSADSELSEVASGISMHLVKATINTIDTPVMPTYSTRRQAYVQSVAGIIVNDVLTAEHARYKVASLESYKYGLTLLHLDQLN